MSSDGPDQPVSEQCDLLDIFYMSPGHSISCSVAKCA